MSRLFSALSDPTRLKILHALTVTEELCVCDLAALAELSVSAVSHQLRLLRDRDLVRARRDGRMVFYSVADDHIADPDGNRCRARGRVTRLSFSRTHFRTRTRPRTRSRRDDLAFGFRPFSENGANTPVEREGSVDIGDGNGNGNGNDSTIRASTIE